MKKFLLFFILAFISAATAMAQEKVDTALLPPVVITSVRSVDARVARSFRRAFPHARNLRWYRQNKDYLVKFIKEDMRHQALFRQNGYIRYDISYGMAHDLTAEIGERVMETYKGYTITHVAKVTRYDQMFWIINLEGMKDFVVVRIAGDDMDEIQHIEKPEN